MFLADSEGFEPPKRFHVCHVSSVVPSTARPTILIALISSYACCRCAYGLTRDYRQYTPSRFVTPIGLEPIITEPKSVVLPITP